MFLAQLAVDRAFRAIDEDRSDEHGCLLRSVPEAFLNFFAVQDAVKSRSANVEKWRQLPEGRLRGGWSRRNELRKRRMSRQVPGLEDHAQRLYEQAQPGLLHGCEQIPQCAKSGAVFTYRNERVFEAIQSNASMFHAGIVARNAFHFATEPTRQALMHADGVPPDPEHLGHSAASLRSARLLRLLTVAGFAVCRHEPQPSHEGYDGVRIRSILVRVKIPETDARQLPEKCGDGKRLEAEPVEKRSSIS